NQPFLKGYLASNCSGKVKIGSWTLQACAQTLVSRAFSFFAFLSAMSIQSVPLTSVLFLSSLALASTRAFFSAMTQETPEPRAMEEGRTSRTDNPSRIQKRCFFSISTSNFMTLPTPCYVPLAGADAKYPMNSRPLGYPGGTAGEPPLPSLLASGGLAA